MTKFLDEIVNLFNENFKEEVDFDSFLKVISDV